jgi:hypothetical protein
MSLDNYDFDVKERVALCCPLATPINRFLRAYVVIRILILDEATSSIDSYPKK